jgi:hypothetical protein
MKEYRIGEVFEDAENFDPPKRLKCVKFTTCKLCAYRGRSSCIKILCTGVHFIETTEPIG